jgi:hypothetical protein
MFDFRASTSVSLFLLWAVGIPESAPPFAVELESAA